MRVIVAVAVACLVMVPEVARACSKRHQSIFELFELATSVAVVKVSGVPGPHHAGPVGLRVKRLFKGRKVASLTARETNTSCATGFRNGRTALVFVGKDRWIVGHYEGYIERPSAAMLDLLQRWATLADDAARATALVDAVASPDRELAFDAAWYLADQPALIAALTASQTAALTAALGDRRTNDVILWSLARQHGQAWKDLGAAGKLPKGLPFAALAAHDYESITDVAALADLMDQHPGEYAPERVAAFERCERLHGKQLEPFSSYGNGVSEQWWRKLADACRTGAPPRW